MACCEAWSPWGPDTCWLQKGGEVLAALLPTPTSTSHPTSPAPLRPPAPQALTWPDRTVFLFASTNVQVLGQGD